MLRTSVPSTFTVLAFVGSPGLFCFKQGGSVTCFAPQVTPAAPVWVSLRVQAPTVTGSYTITAQADPNNWVLETTEANNNRVAPITVN